MANYGMVPYLISMKVRYGQGDASRPIDDIDGRRTRMQDLLAGVLLDAVESGKRFVGAADSLSAYKVSSLRRGKRVLWTTLEVGSRGIKGRLEKEADGSVFHRDAEDSEYVDLRHVLLFPRGGHHALLFAERCGHYGAITFLARALTDSMRQHMPGVTMSVRPLTTMSALHDASINRITFKAPSKLDAAGQFLDDGGPTVEIVAKFKNERHVKDLQTDSGSIDSNKVFGVLADVLESTSGTRPLPKSLDDTHWRADLGITLESGNRRTFELGSGEGPGLAYPVIAKADILKGQTSRRPTSVSHPSDDDFSDACVVALTDIDGQYGVSQSSLNDIGNPDAEWREPSAQRLKVIWDDPASNSEDGPRSIQKSA